jgi:hypothetical protein
MNNPKPAAQDSGFTPATIDALLLDTTPWLSCDECFDRMDTHVEALLRDPSHHDAAMDKHLQGCAACHEEAQSLMALLHGTGR